ncbi:MAG: FAD assembly factor SdhE [Hyphomicrobium sp.]
MSDDLDIRRRRAAYRAMHRGTKEMDALVGRYAAARLPSLEGEALSALERLLAMPDPTLQAWIFGTEDVGVAEFSALIRDIRTFHGLDALRVAAG